jgi:enoyl-CoA hydratase/carnithine racemase
VNRVVAPADLDAAVAKLASTIAAKPRNAVASGKRAFYRHLEMGLEPAYALASEVISCNAASEEGREGLDAFLEKRKPNWK